MEPKPMIIVSDTSSPDHLRISVEGGNVYVVNHNAAADAIHAINNGHTPDGHK